MSLNDLSSPTCFWFKTTFSLTHSHLTPSHRKKKAEKLKLRHQAPEAKQFKFERRRASKPGDREENSLQRRFD